MRYLEDAAQALHAPRTLHRRGAFAANETLAAFPLLSLLLARDVAGAERARSRSRTCFSARSLALGGGARASRALQPPRHGCAASACAALRARLARARRHRALQHRGRAHRARLGDARAHAPASSTIPLELRDPGGLAALACIITATPGHAWARYDARAQRADDARARPGRRGGLDTHDQGALRAATDGDLPMSSSFLNAALSSPRSCSRWRWCAPRFACCAGRARRIACSRWTRSTSTRCC